MRFGSLQMNRANEGHTVGRQLYLNNDECDLKVDRRFSIEFFL